ncbi:MAG: hypothetical protein IT448_11995 [Phycisphaerales bacterium]|nr:hypothetical protein [Phycisphaerales bacterium]
MRWIGLLILLVLCLGGSGCNYVGMFEYAVVGPPLQPAAYKLSEQPTLVLVENYRSPSSLALDADRFGSQLTDELRSNTLTPMIDPAELHRLIQQKGSAYPQMKVSEIARELGARQVVYIDLASCGVEQAGGMMRGIMSYRVKVIDGQTGQTLWPQDAASGQPVEYKTEMQHVTELDKPDMLRTRMIGNMARRTARFFYDWKPVDLNDAHGGSAAGG